MRNLHHAIVTTKRRKIVALVLLAVSGGVIAYCLLRQSDEPKYQGRYLSEWLEQSDRGVFMHGEAQAAVRNIGTNALPHLVKWTSYETPEWRNTLREKFARFLSTRRAVDRWLEGEASRRAEHAQMGFYFLGTNAVSAIPELEALMTNTPYGERSSRAIYALGKIGESAIPVLRARLSDSNQLDRLTIVCVVRSLADSHGTNACLPILLEALNDNDPKVRTEATNGVAQFAPEALTNTRPQ